MCLSTNRDYLGFIPGIVGLTKLVLRFFHNLADLTLVTSPQLKEEMEQWGIKRIAVWRKGIDTQVQRDRHRENKTGGRKGSGADIRWGVCIPRMAFFWRIPNALIVNGLMKGRKRVKQGKRCVSDRLGLLSCVALVWSRSSARCFRARPCGIV